MFRLSNLAFLLLLGVSAHAASQEIDARVVKHVFGGRDNVAILQQADQITASRLTRTPNAEPEYREEQSKPMPAAIARRVREILLSSDTYVFESAKACDPVYGVRFTFAKAKDRIAIDLCFSCETLAVFRDGKSLGGEDFDQARPELVTICKQLFPNDKVIQGLQRR